MQLTLITASGFTLVTLPLESTDVSWNASLRLHAVDVQRKLRGHAASEERRRARIHLKRQDYVRDGGWLEVRVHGWNAVVPNQVQQRGGSPSVQITLAFQGNQASLIKAPSLMLNISEGQVSIDFQFEMRMTFVDGVLVKSPPQPIAA
jgi:hypothetical protein